VKVQVTLYHTMEATDGHSRCTAVFLLTFGTRCGWMGDAPSS